MKLKGKTATLTAGARGIGRAISERYAAKGATVVVADRDEAGANEVANAIGGSAYGIGFDVTAGMS